MEHTTKYGPPATALLLLVFVFFLLAGCGGGDEAPQVTMAPDADGSAPAGEQSPTVARTDPNLYAPLAEVSGGADESRTRTARMMIESARVPSRSEVEIPPYPGARIVQVQPASRVDLNNASADALPVIVMISDDSPPQVLEFYRGELPDWNHGEFYLNHVFWQGDGEYDPLEMSGFVTPSVMVMEPVGDRAQVFSGTQTEIQIRYRPGAN